MAFGFLVIMKWWWWSWYYIKFKGKVIACEIWAFVGASTST